MCGYGKQAPKQATLLFCLFIVLATPEAGKSALIPQTWPLRRTINCNTASVLPMAHLLYMDRDARGEIIVRKLRRSLKHHPSPSLTLSADSPSYSTLYSRDLYDTALLHPSREMPTYHDDPWYADDQSPRHQAAHRVSPQAGRPVSIESDGSRSPKPRVRDFSKYASFHRSTHKSHKEINSFAVSPGTRIYPCTPIPSQIHSEPSIPFIAAAQQLDRTIRCAIVFFDNFHLTFRESSDGLKFHANKSLLNKIWQSQILASSASPTHDWYNRKSKRNNQTNPNENPNNYQQQNGYQQDMNGNSTNNNGNTSSRSPSPTAEVLSFNEYQSQVLSRVSTLIHSKMPVMPTAASRYIPPSPSPYTEDYDDEHDQEVAEARNRHYAAATLRKKMGQCYEDLKGAVDAMGRDHIYAKQAIREMKVVKQQLVTYSQAWDERWEDNGGWDSDEDERHGKGDQQ
jgi:hypothetical protein